MPRYRKKPDIVEAIRLSWATWEEIGELMVRSRGVSPENFAYHILAEEATDTMGEPGPNYLAFVVTNAQGEANTVRHGDWLVPDSKPGTFFPLKPEEFAAKYEEIEE